MADVDAVNERLNGLVTLLQAVGVSGDKVSRDLLPDARQLNDDQVEALIKKLQQAQAEAPQIIAALEAHAEARSLNGGAAPSRGKKAPPPPPEEVEEDEDDDSDYDENENYPMVGAGCSDDISVVSDLTTPTVLTGVPVPEEEHYRDTLPPMIVGGGPGEAPPMMINPTKRKNLVGGAPRPGALAPPRRNTPNVRGSGGAAAARRKNYQSTMAKLSENPHAYGAQQSPRKPVQRRASISSSASNHNGVSKPKRSSSTKASSANNFSELASSRAHNEWESPSWNAFESKPARKQVDNDGFLVSESFDPFAQSEANNPFKSTAGDLEFSSSSRHRNQGFSSNASADGFDAFGVGSSGGERRRPKSSKPRPPGEKPRKPPSSSGGVAPPRGGPESRPRRARRASLAM